MPRSRNPKIVELIKFKLGLSLLSSPKTPTLKEILFKSQKGLCGLCNNPIDFDSLYLNTVHIHHIRHSQTNQERREQI